MILLPLIAAIVRRSAWRGSKSVDARTISSPTRQPAASSTSIEVLPAFAVFASLVQVLVRSPCRFSVPPEIMIPRSPMPAITSSFWTVLVRVIVALRVCGARFAADRQLAVQHDPLGRELEVGVVREGELAVDGQPAQRGRAHVEDHFLVSADGDLVARDRHLVVRPGRRIGPVRWLGRLSPSLLSTYDGKCADEAQCRYKKERARLFSHVIDPHNMTLTGNSAAKDSAVCRHWRMAGVRSQHTNFEPEPEVLAELRAATSKVPHNVMQIGADQGALMALLVKLIGAKRCIEVGTYTGYSALAVALALPTDGTVIACDVSTEWTAVGQPFWRKAGVADRIDLRIGPGLERDTLLMCCSARERSRGAEEQRDL